MKTFLKKYWLIIALAFLATILAVLKITTPQYPPPQIVSLKPDPQKPQTKEIKEIQIIFNQPAKNLLPLLRLITTPKTKLNITTVEEKLIIQTDPPLQTGKRYLFELYYQNNLLYSWQYQITPSPTPTKAIREVGDPQIIKNLARETTEDFPLIKLMPYSDKDVAINYLKPRVLGIKIKNKKEKELVKKKILDWLEKRLDEVGLDLESHKIVWLD